MTALPVLLGLGIAVSACLPVAPDAKPASKPATTPTTKPAATTPTPALTGTSSVAGLNASGSTIPSTSYSIPSHAVFISPAGKDTNAGTSSAPVRTLARAYALVPAAGTIVARGGTYRDGNLVARKAFTLQAYPHEQPWFDGTNVVTGWTSDGKGHWYVSWSTPDFCQNATFPSGGYYSQTWPWLGTPANAGPCIHPDMADDPANPAAADPQMAFINNRALSEVTSLAEVTGTSFWYDFAHRRVYIGASPSGQSVELTKRANAIVTRNLTTGTRFLGIGFRRYASNEKNEGSTTHGALTVVGTPNVLLENDVFSLNAGTALNFLSGAKNVMIRHDVFAFNGFNGVDANGTESNDNFTITGSVFDHSNTELFGLGCLASCTAAGSKIAHMDNFTISNNVFRGGQGVANGFWCDLHCSRGTITGNLVSGNGNIGLLYEVSDTGVIADNLVIGNGFYLASRQPNGANDDASDRGAGIRVAASNTQIVNNTVANNSSAFVIYDDARSPGAACPGCTTHDVGPDTMNVTVLNNVVSGPVVTDPYGSWIVGTFRRNFFSGVTSTGPDTFYGRFDYDSYYRPNALPAKLFWWDNDASDRNSLTSLTNAFGSLTDVRAARNIESSGQDITSGPDPFFVNAAGGNYCLKTTSPAAGSGAGVTAPIAKILGVTAGQAVNRGALGWLGQRCTPTG